MLLRRLALLLALVAAPLQPLRGQTPDISDADVAAVTVGDPFPRDRRAVAEPRSARRALAAYGPFRVLDATRAALVAGTDSASPAQFAAMLRAFPWIALIEMIECPGTQDDRANLLLGRMIRAHGIATLVPAGGSVRSGGVELFLAGARRSADPAAEFAVHSWVDEDGREARDYPADAPENRAYIEYYREMGMAPGQAQAFYAMTNAAPFSQARWLSGAEMAQWVSLN